jgi:hypothetical protein
MAAARPFFPAASPLSCFHKLSPQIDISESSPGRYVDGIATLYSQGFQRDEISLFPVCRHFQRGFAHGGSRQAKD